MKSHPKSVGQFEIAILAGGLSTRMGRDKSRLRLGRRTLLGIVRQAAAMTGLSFRVIRRDLVPRCGPLGGVYTGLKRSRSGYVIFLSCDMPFVSPELMGALMEKVSRRPGAWFCVENGFAGFPFALPSGAIAEVERLLAEGRFSLQALADAVKARRFSLPASRRGELLNVNTPADWETARRLWREAGKKDGGGRRA